MARQVGWFWAPGVFTAATSTGPPEVAGGFYVDTERHTPGSVGQLIEASRTCEPDLLWSFVGAIQRRVADSRRRRVANASARPR